MLLDVLAVESGHALDWMMVQGAHNDEVSRQALLGDPGPLIEMMTNITRDLTPEETPQGSRAAQHVHTQAPLVEQGEARDRLSVHASWTCA